MINFYEQIVNNPAYFKQLRCGESLVTIYNCPLENKCQDIWSQHNYIAFVLKGRKVWHTPHGSYDLHEGACVFVRKGASIVEQFLDVRFCLVIFFVPDEFICEVLKSKSSPIYTTGKNYAPVMAIEPTVAVQHFFQSMLHYFEAQQKPDDSLLQLKFRELVLTIADNAANEALLCYFCSLLKEPQAVSLQRVMEDNFCFNLKLETFARLSTRSLSAFKRDFEKLYKTSPGKWLMEKRLNHALHLLTNMNKTVTEAAFESGFENTSHFSRSFRQRFGISPASARQAAAV